MAQIRPTRQANRPRATASTVCQKCHFIYECKSERPYALAKLKAAGKPSVDVPEEFKKKDGTANRILEEKAKERGKGKERENKKAKRSSSSDSDSDSDSDSSSSGSGSDSSSSSDSSGRSRERDRKRRVPTKRDRSRSKSP
ncbi:hypothetical protein B0H13DRAFT_1948968 [Mycena leptocephala]|nr:hypothetical protein B0H13DRAFT_1948968 [Mycena leptocephala]